MIVDNNIQQYRYSICEQCEHFTNLKFCNKCNCFMPVKTKLSHKRCPIDKWDRIIATTLDNDK